MKVQHAARNLCAAGPFTGGGVVHRRRRTLPPARLLRLSSLALAMLLALTAVPTLGEETAEPTAADGPSYKVTDFVVKYAQEADGQVPLGPVVASTDIQLGQTQAGYVAPRDGVPTVQFELDEVGTLSEQRFFRSAIHAIGRQLVAALNERGLVGVIVGADASQIADDGEDLRGNSTQLTLLVMTGTVSQVRTVAAGDRVPESDRKNASVHGPIIERSPVQPGQAIRKDVLDAYLLWLNRHPNRRVDASLSADTDNGGVALDYLVAENKPWLLYGQVSNTGTESTDEWRYRLGFKHTQLTNNDDILNFEYVTNGFEEAHAAILSYDAPFQAMPRLRWKVFGSWSEYDASVIGLFGSPRFEGESYSVGGELSYNIYQKDELFIDLFGGARWQSHEVENIVGGSSVKADEEFFIPRLGVALERVTDTMTTFGSVDLEFNLADLADTSESPDLDEIGRTEPDEDWVVLHWGLYHSFYLEPLLFGEKWEDPQSQYATLAHEVRVSFDGQYAFDNRLISQEQKVVGGLYTVRGYEESTTAGDTVVVGRFEYLFHVPRAFARQPEPGTLFGQPFRYAPQQPYGRADWNLALRAFLDVGRVWNSDEIDAIEEGNTLVGGGLGVELAFKNNATLRLDWGVALSEVEDAAGDTLQDSGDSRLHVVFTVAY